MFPCLLSLTIPNFGWGIDIPESHLNIGTTCYHRKRYPLFFVLGVLILTSCFCKRNEKMGRTVLIKCMHYLAERTLSKLIWLSYTMCAFMPVFRRLAYMSRKSLLRLWFRKPERFYLLLQSSAVYFPSVCKCATGYSSLHFSKQNFVVKFSSTRSLNLSCPTLLQARLNLVIC